MSRIMNAAKSAVAELRALVEKTRYSRADLAQQLQDAESERKRLLSAPLCRADLESVLLRDLKAQQQAALDSDELLADLRYTQTSAISHQLSGDAASSSPFVSGNYSQSLIDLLIFALGDPDAILKRLQPVIDRIDFKTAGPPLSERASRLSALDKTLTALRADLAEIESVLSNADPNQPTRNDPKPGERRELAPGRWAVWLIMPHSQVGFWQWEGEPVFRTAPNQPIQ